MTISNQKYIHKKFGRFHALWFRASKSFVLLAVPAFKVFELYTSGTEVTEIMRRCKQLYGHLEDDIPTFVSEIIEQIRYFSNPENGVNFSRKSKVKNIKPVKFSLPAVVYHMGDQIIQIQYANQELKAAIHPALAHLETKNTGTIPHRLECFSKNKLLVYKYNGKVMDAFSRENLSYFTGGFKQLLYSILYNKKYNGWMSVHHASGIHKNGQAVLFSAGSGKGKSTISALLKAHGYGYLSDDLTAVDKRGKTYPFPGAISVKKNAAAVLQQYYPELEKCRTVKTMIGKEVCYVPVFNLGPGSEKGFEVKAFVFVNYDRHAGFLFEEMEKPEALQHLLAEAWINPVSENVTGFFNWVEQTAFYRLTYSETTQALEAVRKILG